MEEAPTPESKTQVPHVIAYAGNLRMAVEGAHRERLARLMSDYLEYVNPTRPRVQGNSTK